ncbi:MAG: hypothetical protein IJA33_01585 [Oscillospiraceae bacterium]|nr:hypothetical protein [Oscillospiraceae bacterium]
MKKKCIAFVLAGMMVLSLVGCGEQKDPTGSVGDNNSSVTDEGGTNSNAKSVVPGNEKGRTWDTDVRSGNRDYDFDNNHGSTFGGVGEDNTVYDGMGGYRTDRTATWQQMLENGRVHDRDGFLLDGENTTW